MRSHFTLRGFHAAAPETADSAALVAAKAAPAPRPSFQYQEIRSRWSCPPTWLHSVNTATSAIRNSAT